jgi:hypothetical protein
MRLRSDSNGISPMRGQHFSQISDVEFRLGRRHHEGAFGRVTLDFPGAVRLHEIGVVAKHPAHEHAHQGRVAGRIQRLGVGGENTGGLEAHAADLDQPASDEELANRHFVFR